jgi:hypothetical protein
MRARFALVVDCRDQGGYHFRRPQGWRPIANDSATPATLTGKAVRVGELSALPS